MASSQNASDNSSWTDDPVAKSTKWTPLKGGGINFCTHTLQQVNELKLAFKPSFVTKLFSFL